jgi:hypothetical protein
MYALIWRAGNALPPSGTVFRHCPPSLPSVSQPFQPTRLHVGHYILRCGHHTFAVVTTSCVVVATSCTVVATSCTVVAKSYMLSLHVPFPCLILYNVQGLLHKYSQLMAMAKFVEVTTL